MLRPRFFGVILRFLLNSYFVLFFRSSKSGVLLFFIIVSNKLSCCTFRGRLSILPSLFSFLEMVLYNILMVEFLLLLIRLTLNPLSLRYYLGFVEIFCQVLRFFIVIALEIDKR